MIRLTPQHRGDTKSRPPRTAAGLVQARLDGRLDRRAMLARGAALGLSAPVLDILLHATSDAAFGIPRARQDATPTTDQPRPTGAEFRRATTPLQPPGTPLTGGRLVIAAPAEPETLHPWRTTSAAGFDVLAAVMDGLLRYDGEHRLQPALATEFDLSDDGLVYTFALRDGVAFHDGTPFAAADVVASWRAITNRALAAASLFGWDKIEAVEAPDELTVTFRTTEPYAPFLSWVGTTPICPASAIADDLDRFRAAFDRAPIGTGPFRLADWLPGDRIILERYDDYWGVRPRLDRVEVRFAPELEARFSGFERGRYQLVAGADGLPPARVDDALEIPAAVVVEHGTQSWQHLDLKQIGFLRETRVRQALDFATPRQRIVDDLLAGRAIPAFADQAPGSWAYNPALEPRPYLPERAATLLDQAGLGVGPDGIRTRDGEPFAIELWAVAGDPLAEQIIDLIATSWGELGIAATPRFGDAATLWGPMGYQFSDRMTAALYTWTNANDPDNMLYWHSSQIPLSPTAGGGNLPAFFHPYNFQDVIDALTAEAATTFDRAARRELYWQIQELLVREVPVIFLYWERAYALASPNLGGFWPSPFTPLLWNVQDWYLAGPPPPEPLPDASDPSGTPVPATP